MAAPCTLTICRTATGYLFRIAGRGTMHESPTVRDFVCGAIEDGVDVALDLSACDYLDSTFQGCLVMLHRRGRSGSGSFAIFADEPTRKKLLGCARLDRYLAFVEECPPFTEAPVSLQVSALERKEFAQHALETHRQLAELGGPTAETFARIAEQIAKELGAP